MVYVFFDLCFVGVLCSVCGVFDLRCVFVWYSACCGVWLAWLLLLFCLCGAYCVV